MHADAAKPRFYRLRNHRINRVGGIDLGAENDLLAGGWAIGVALSSSPEIFVLFGKNRCIAPAQSL
jgi:hypothetical protein